MAPDSDHNLPSGKKKLCKTTQHEFLFYSFLVKVKGRIHHYWHCFINSETNAVHSFLILDVGGGGWYKKLLPTKELLAIMFILWLSKHGKKVSKVLLGFYCVYMKAHSIRAQWFGTSQFSENCTSNFDPFWCFLANYKSWASQMICLFHVKFDFWYSMVCLKFGYFGAYYIIFLVNGVCLISFLGPLGPTWYFQGVIFSYIGTFFVYQTLMSSLIEGMLILY